MSYDYQTQRANIFTEDGQILFLEIRDNAKSLLGKSGAVRMSKLWQGCCGDSWDMLACVDRLVELGELHEIPQGNVVAQNRVFVGGRP